jgi:actin-related protein
VFDVGHFSFRAGYAGEDTPKAEVPSMVGVADDPNNTVMDMDTANGNGMGGSSSSDMKPTPRKKYTIDTVNVNAPKAGTKILPKDFEGVIGGGGMRVYGEFG